MNKREFLKTGLMSLAAASVALSGCSKDNKESDNNELNIEPRQTATYEFSVPLPFNYKTIDELTELNSKYKKSQIISLHNNTPEQLCKKFNHSIQVFRTENNIIKTQDDFWKYVKYAKDNGFEFTYLMNSPKPFSEKDFDTFKDDFLFILDKLKKYDCKNIKVGNTQVAAAIEEYAPNEFILSASTAFEYSNISQYNYLFNNYPNFNLIDVTNGENHNFKFLKALRDKFPKIKLELMVNEQCIKGCPARISHIAEPTCSDYKCWKLMRSIGPLLFYIKTGIILPWNLEYYSAIGINNFKFIVLDGFNDNFRSNFHDTTNLSIYLDCVEFGCENMKIKDFFRGVYSKLSLSYSRYRNLKMADMSVSEIKDLFPDINHFIKYGHECAYKCGLRCNYCMECAKKLGSVLV